MKNDRGTNVVQTVGPENPVKNDRGTNGTNDAIVVVNPVQTKKRPRYKRGTNGRSRYKRKNDRGTNEKMITFANSVSHYFMHLKCLVGKINPEPKLQAVKVYAVSTTTP